MAQRRMFSKIITNSSKFLMMPNSAQNLYFHLGMNADDDGYVEHFTIMRMTESKPDDLKILHAKEFVKIFDEKVLVILDWKENNYIRSDRYTKSKYLELYKQSVKEITDIGDIREEFLGIPNGNQKVDEWDTQVRLGKDSIGKDNKTKEEESNNDSFNVKELHKLIVEAFHNYHLANYNSKFKFLKKDFGIIKNIVNFLKDESNPMDILLIKLDFLDKKVKQDITGKFYHFTPAKLLSLWNELRDNRKYKNREEFENDIKTLQNQKEKILREAKI